MRLLTPSAVLLSLCACVPALSQNALLSSNSAANVSPAAPSANASKTVTDPDDASVDYATLRDAVARQNKILADKVAAQKAQVRKNEMILHDAQKMDAANRRLDAERKRLEAANAQLEKERQSLESTQKPVESAAVAPQSSGN